jgi:hypothetical protein
LARTDNNSPEVLRALRTLAAYFRRNNDFTNTENYYQQAIAVAQYLGDADSQRVVERQLEDLRTRRAVLLQEQSRR